MERCGWVSQDPLYIAYHDNEWGVPETDSKKLFEMICLEGQQAGLSWITVLKKRENYRACFHQFDPVKVAAMQEEDVERLVQDAGIIRHRGKIQAIIGNARAYLQMEQKRRTVCRLCLVVCKSSATGDTSHNVERNSHIYVRLRRPI